MVVLIFKFNGGRTDVAYLQTMFANTVGNIGSTSDQLENEKSFYNETFIQLR
jgi:hypothetical protein